MAIVFNRCAKVAKFGQSGHTVQRSSRDGLLNFFAKHFCQRNPKIRRLLFHFISFLNFFFKTKDNCPPVNMIYHSKKLSVTSKNLGEIIFARFSVTKWLDHHLPIFGHLHQ